MVRVLMIGWEFPPLFSGGLGIATYGIVKSLHQLSQIRLIIPTSAVASDLLGVDIIGLNNLRRHEINDEKLSFALQFENTQVLTAPVRISPYHHANEILGRINSLETRIDGCNRSMMESIESIFSGKEVYGHNIMSKVNLFAKISEELAADGNFDVIHSHDWVTFPAAVRIKMRTGKPLVVHVHALETDRVGEGVRNEIYWLEKNGMEQANSIIAVSEYTKNQIVHHYKIDPSKIYVIHNGIEPAQVARKSHQLKEKLVVFLGRITQQKGPQFLVETAEKVSKVYPKVKFVVAGTGDQFAHVLERSAHKKLGDKFIFAGFLSKTKVNELLSMADVYFMPSVSEPFGLTALEAAQYGVPSVLSSRSGAAEVMKASLQAEYWDTDKYANYIYALLRYGALSTELAEKATNQLDHLTWDLTAGKIMSVYRDLLQ